MSEGLIAWLVNALQMALVYGLAAATVISVIVLIIAIEYLRVKDQMANEKR